MCLSHFIYLCSKGGEIDASLKFNFHLKYDKGFIFNPSLTKLGINTESFYANGYATTAMTLSTLKEKNPLEQAKTLSAALLTVTVLLG